MDLKGLSTEELEKLRLEITSLIDERYIPKYKEGECFINPNKLSFGYIIGIFSIKYDIVVNSLSGGDHTIERVREPYLDDCIFISQEDYDELYVSRNDLYNDFYAFRDERNKEIQDFMNSLERKFKQKVKEVIKKYKK